MLPHHILYLLQLIDSLGGLDSDLEEAKYASHNVYNGVRDVSGSTDVVNMSAGILEHEGLDKLGSQALGELWRGLKGILLRQTIELLEGYI